MKAIANSTPNCGKAPEHKLIVLDFTEHDTIELLQMLLDKAKAGQIEGIVVAARMGRRYCEPYLFASSGRLAVNQAEAIGAAALLQNKLTTEF